MVSPSAMAPSEHVSIDNRPIEHAIKQAITGQATCRTIAHSVALRVRKTRTPLNKQISYTNVQIRT